MERMTVWLVLALALGLLVARPAAAMTMSDCEMTPTVASLHHCVHHAVEMGAITNAGVAKSLLAKLDAALIAEAQGQSQAVIGLLNSFIYEVNAQSGISIDPEHAQHMATHARAVIRALQAG
ncbi:MAG TPA: hypothetical protein VFZ66_13215 [Herpetosiphonaceae bacterium]